MRVLLDSDVIFDFLLERQPFFPVARELMLLNTSGEFEGYISSITPVNLFYHGRKIVGAVKIRAGIADLLKLVRVCPIDHVSLEQALSLPFADYEDAVQHARDYKNASLQVFTPDAFLQHLKASQEQK